VVVETDRVREDFEVPAHDPAHLMWRMGFGSRAR